MLLKIIKLKHWNFLVTIPDNLFNGIWIVLWATHLQNFSKVEVPNTKKTYLSISIHPAYTITYRKTRPINLILL